MLISPTTTMSKNAATVTEKSARRRKIHSTLNNNNNVTLLNNMMNISNIVYLRMEYLLSKIQKANNQAMQKSTHYKCIYNKSKPHLYTLYKLLRFILVEILSILKDMLYKTSCRQKLWSLLIVTIYIATYIYYIKLPIWEYENEWHTWEIHMQHSVSNLIPPPLSLEQQRQLNKHDNIINLDNEWNTNIIQQFPYLIQQQLKDSSSSGGGGTRNENGYNNKNASEYIVPIPDYELMGITRGKLARRLRKRAIQSCQNGKKQHQQHQQYYYMNDEDGRTTSKRMKYSSLIPVLGITVANDTPENRYLRRLLHTIDLDTVKSIVVTWYDEQTEAQLVGIQDKSPSHDVVEETLKEYIGRKRFKEISWREHGSDDDNHDNSTTEEAERSTLLLADTKSLTVLSRIATSIQQFCIFDTDQVSSARAACQNELIILRFSTNLGCSSGVNNPLFTHPMAPHWLIVNYDIAYPPGVLKAMATELQKTKQQKPNLAVHTYGYIYGRGKLENPWSNFIMTSCAVANVGVWDENIFPSYYEDDDYRDRIRYILGEWNDVIGDPDIYENIPQKYMNDTHVIRYQTDRNVSVVHGPLDASTYLSGTHETLQKVLDEERAYNKKSYLEKLWLWMVRRSKSNSVTPTVSSFHYESQRWSLAKEVSSAEDFFRCKHGSIPEQQDSMRYFGWHERFLVPFVNRTRVTRLRESRSLLTLENETSDQERRMGFSGVDHNSYSLASSNPSPWAAWNFNATRRRCVHHALNVLLAMPSSEEKTNLTQHFKELCSVC